MSKKINKYIWTFPLSIALLAFLGNETTTVSSPLGVIVLIILIGGLVGYIVDVVVSSIKAKRLEM